MRLKIGDKLYLRPDKVDEFKVDDPASFFYKLDMSRDDLKRHEFEVISTRASQDDICITWIDGTKWWWGQMYESEPWTLLFISHVEYLRFEKLEELGV